MKSVCRNSACRLKCTVIYFVLCKHGLCWFTVENALMHTCGMMTGTPELWDRRASCPFAFCWEGKVAYTFRPGFASNSQPKGHFILNSTNKFDGNATSKPGLSFQGALVIIQSAMTL